MSANHSKEDKYAAEAPGDAGAALTYPAQASSLRKNGFAILKDKPCKILEISTAKPGKHGHAKCTFRGKDIFTGAGVEDSHPSSHNMEVPLVKRTEYDLMDISRDGFLSLLGNDGLKDDVKLPQGEVGEKIKNLMEDGKSVVVVILAAMGEEMAIDAKSITEN